MPFNHYAKIKRILENEQPGWVIKLVNKPTQAKNFKGELTSYTHYYRIYDKDGSPIKYCKFQQIERLSSILETPIEALPIID